MNVLAKRALDAQNEKGQTRLSLSIKRLGSPSDQAIFKAQGKAGESGAEIKLPHR